MHCALPLQGSKATTAQDQQVRVFSFNFLTDHILRISLLYPSFTLNLQYYIQLLLGFRITLYKVNVKRDIDEKKTYRLMNSI